MVYESLVKPYNRITNYLTKFSGITEKMLENVEKRLEDVQNDLIQLLPSDAILVGHSLNTDLHAIKVCIRNSRIDSVSWHAYSLITPVFDIVLQM